MMFWGLVLLISLLFVLGVAAPLLRTRSTGEANAAVAKGQWFAAGLVALAPIAAGALYLGVGTPEGIKPPAPQLSPQEQIAAMSEEERRAAIENMVAGLAAELEQNPDDIDGWRMLARSYDVLGQAPQAAAAYKALLERDENALAQDWRNYAGALLASRARDAEGYDPEFLTVIKKLRSFNEDDPLALFYLGLMAREEGDSALALAYWRRLSTILPADAPIMGQLHALIAELESTEN